MRTHSAEYLVFHSALYIMVLAFFFFLFASLNIPVINVFNGNPAVTNIKFIVV